MVGVVLVMEKVKEVERENKEGVVVVMGLL